MAWKKVACGIVLKLLITGKRISTPIGRKCRTDSCKVLEARHMNGNATAETVFQSKHDSGFVYKLGETVTAELDEDIRVECTNGIHFFMTKKEAEEY